MNLHGPVRAAETATPGSAEVTLSFDAWSEGGVAPSAHHVPVDRPKVVIKPEPVSPRLIRSLVHPDRKADISLLRFSSDGRRLAVAGYPSGVVQIWDAAAGKEPTRIETPPGLRGTDDYVALTADWKTAFVPRDGRKVVRAEVDGEKRVTINYDGEVQVWDLATRKMRPPIKLERGRGASEAFVSPDGTKLVTVEARSYDPKGVQYVPHVAVYRDLSGGGQPVELATAFSMAAFDPHGRTFALASGDRGKHTARFQLFDALTGKPAALLADESNAHIFFPAYSPDGGRVAAEVREAAEKASVIKVWDTVSGREVAVLKPTERTLALEPAFSGDGRFVTAFTTKEAQYVWDAATGAVVLTYRFGDTSFVRTVVVSPDARLAAISRIPGVGSKDLGRDTDPADLPQPHVDLYNLSTGKLVETLVCPTGFPGRLTFSPDGKTLAVGGTGAVHLFDITDVLDRNRR